MFVRKKTKPRGGNAYHQLVESRRVDGKPRQKVVMHLGGYPTVDEALEDWPRAIRQMRSEAARNERFDPEGSERLRSAADGAKAKLDRLKGLRSAGEV